MLFFARRDPTHKWLTVGAAQKGRTKRSKKRPARTRRTAANTNTPTVVEIAAETTDQIRHCGATGGKERTIYSPDAAMRVKPAKKSNRKKGKDVQQQQKTVNMDAATRSDGRERSGKEETPIGRDTRTPTITVRCTND